MASNFIGDNFIALSLEIISALKNHAHIKKWILEAILLMHPPLENPRHKNKPGPIARPFLILTLFYHS